MKMDAAQHDNFLEHYGILRKSGRYPWGSGKDPLQRSRTFLEVTNGLKKQGFSDVEICKSFSTKEDPFTTADLRALRTRANAMVKQDLIQTAQRLQNKGMSPSAIARQMSTSEKTYNESSIRSLLAPGRQEKLDVLQATADMLRKEVNEKGFLDVGAHVNLDLPIGDNPEARMQISTDKFKTALSILKEEGYNVHDVHIPQVGTREMTTYLVLTKPGVTRKEAFANKDKIQQITKVSPDGGRSWKDAGLVPPLSISSKRVSIKYKEQGGADADGVIYVRPGVKDIELGKSHYAQVRIAVDGTHYLKGMAVYKDDLPPGVDLMFNTNKSNTGNKLDAMKPMKRDKDGNIDPDNPFGAAIKIGGQIKNEHGHATSAMNLVNEEGDWNKWSKNLSRQVLSKQKRELAESQLNLTYDRRIKEFEKIKSLTNPQVRQKLLESFSDETDSAAVHLKAAYLPNQATKVILPSNYVKPHEIFVPTLDNGTRVALIRFPHAGLFEIPELTVNNNSREAKKLVGIGKGGTAPDVAVIHPKVAERLSGADFDGDAVVVIPNDRGKITSRPPLEGLKNFDPRSEYPPYHGMKTIDGGIYDAKTKEVDYGKKADGTPKGPKLSRKQQEMGNVTNLIADMTIKGAPNDHIARAVRHSMVVIDSEKHVLDFKESARRNGIVELKRKYQGVHDTGQLKGAATLITRATAQTHVDEYRLRKPKEGGPIDKNTGEKVFVPTGRLRSDGTPVTIRSKRLVETKDAHTLLSEGIGQPIERIYADHSNRLKDLANQARKEMVNTELIPYNPSSRKAYATEVASLDSKLRTALLNSPRERQAQVLANTFLRQRKLANPDMDRDTEKKLRGQLLTEARLRTDAHKDRIVLTDKEWQAIQAGAITKTQLGKILQNADIDSIRAHATPKQHAVMSGAEVSRAKSMVATGYTLKEIADHLGVSLSTVQRELAK